MRSPSQQVSVDEAASLVQMVGSFPDNDVYAEPSDSVYCTNISAPHTLRPQDMAISCGKDRTSLFHEIGKQRLRGNGKHKNAFKIVLCPWLGHPLLDAGLLMSSVRSVLSPPLLRTRHDVKLITSGTIISCDHINATLVLWMQEFAL